MLSQVVLALLGSLALGVLLVVLGLRGKRLNKHPVCRDCRFDLSAQPSGVITCPECGAGLKRPKAIRIGQRRKRPVFLGVGVLAALVPLGTFGFAGFAAATGTGLDKHKPLGLLLWERSRGGASRSQPIAAELLARYQNKKLSEDQSKRVLEEALNVQGDPKAAWAQEWADLLDAAKVDGKLSPQQLGRFNSQSAALEFKVRPRVTAGDPLPIFVRCKENRAGSGAMLTGSLNLKEAQIDGTKAGRVRESEPGKASFGPGNSQVAYFNISGPKSRWGMMLGQDGGGGALFRVPKDMAPGRHTFKFTGVLKLEPMPMNGGGYNPFKAPKKDDPNAREVTFEGSFEVLPGGEASVAVKPADAATDEQMTKQIQVITQAQRFAGNMGWLQLNLDTLKTPIAYDIYMTVDGSEKRVGRFSSSKTEMNENMWWSSQDSTRNVYLELPSGFKGGATDLTLKPNPKLAARTVEQDSIYGGTIVLKDGDLGKPNASEDTIIRTGVFPGLLQSLFR